MVFAAVGLQAPHAAPGAYVAAVRESSTLGVFAQLGIRYAVFADTATGAVPVETQSVPLPLRLDLVLLAAPARRLRWSSLVCLAGAWLSHVERHRRIVAVVLEGRRCNFALPFKTKDAVPVCSFRRVDPHDRVYKAAEKFHPCLRVVHAGEPAIFTKHLLQDERRRVVRPD